MSRSNGRPEPEVIMNYQDGASYVKGKMDAAFQSGGILEKPPPKPTKEHPNPAVKKEDVDLIVHELEISRSKAEKVLAEHNGDIKSTLRALVIL